MSKAAREERAVRQLRAAPGGRQDRTVRWARRVLPIAAAGLIALLALAPLTSGKDVSFLLDKNKVDVAPERMRAEAAEYRGQDDKGQPFSVSAGAAVQRTSADPTIRMDKLSAKLGLRDGPASITAERGRYDVGSERMAIDGPVQFDAANGYKLETRNVVVDLKTRTMASGGQVEGRMPLGTFSADTMRADLGERHVVLEGRARLQIRQGALN